MSRARFLPLFPLHFAARESQHVRLEQIIDRCKIKTIGFRERIELRGDGFEHYSRSDPTERTAPHQSGSERINLHTLLKVLADLFDDLVIFDVTMQMHFTGCRYAQYTQTLKYIKRGNSLLR